MDDNELTSEEISILLEALVAWEDKDASGELLGALLSSMVGSAASPETKEKLEREEAERSAKATAAKRIRKEQSVMLQAKLMSIRPRRIAEGIDAALRAKS